MKRLLAFLLVLCMMVGLLACGKPGTGPDTNTTEGSKETTPIRDDISNIEEDDLAISSGDVDSNDAYISPEKFAGKKLQIAGLNSDQFADLDNMGVGNYNWMIRAAIDEWATLNQVEVTFECSDDSTDILAAINSGTKLDLSFGSNEMPVFPNMGITKAFTQEQRDLIAKICGAGFVDMMKYKGESHGVVYPWTGNHMFYYNRTVFENYGAKTPGEYFMEDNWTWDTMEQVFESVTRDFNGNGKMDENDTFGIGGTFSHLTYYLQYTEDDTGKVTGTIGTNEQFKRYLDIVHKGRTQTLSVALKGTQYCTTTATPRAVTQVGDCEWYNFEHLYQTLENGDVIEAIIVPAYSKENPLTVVNYTTRFMSMLSSCDEPEAAFSLLCYILKCGMRYIADYSCGLYKSTYEGIRGASDWSAGWKKNFEAVCEDRRAAFAEIEDWDQERYEKMIALMFHEDTVMQTLKKYTGAVSKVAGLTENRTLPSSSLIPLLVAEQDAWIAKYNELYAN